MQALKHLAPGGRLVINAIRKEEVDKQELLGLDFPSQLWLEKEIKTVANVTRQDVREFLATGRRGRHQARGPGVRSSGRQSGLARSQARQDPRRQGAARDLESGGRMAYSEELAIRMRAGLRRARGLQEKKMFGGIGFLVNGNMACGVHGQNLIVRLGTRRL